MGETVVYPMGTNNGIDPMSSEYINSIPYPMPSKDTQHDPRAQFADSRKKSGTADPGWSRSPRILLVEDDPTCRQIGGKFLYSFNCVVDSAFDGLEAVSKMQEGNKYDMILMDIHHGMDDVLPKPFTRKSLLDMLEKHLMHLKKVPQMEVPPMAAIAPAGGLPSTSHSVRDDMSAGASPAGSS